MRVLLEKASSSRLCHLKPRGYVPMFSDFSSQRFESIAAANKPFRSQAWVVADWGKSFADLLLVGIWIIAFLLVFGRLFLLVSGWLT